MSPIPEERRQHLDIYDALTPSPTSDDPLASATVLRLMVTLTYRCNAHCLHCSMRPYERHASEELTPREIERVAREARLAGIHTAVLFGGEPTVRRDVHDIVARLSRHVPNVMMETNGLAIDDAYARRLADAGLARVFVSLHGADAETHASITREHTFARVLEAIHSCVDAGLETHISVSVTREMLEDGGLKRIIQFARASGLHGVRLLLPALAGLWRESTDVLLTAEEQAAVSELADGQFAYVEIDGLRASSCRAIYEGYYFLSPYGEIQPCNYLPVCLGNVREEPLVDIARRAAIDVPFFARDVAFRKESFRCIATEARARDIFRGPEGELIAPPLDNIIDLGGTSPPRDAATEHRRQTRMAVQDPRPARTTDAISADIARAAEFGHSRVRLVGGDYCARDDRLELARTLADHGLGATLVCDARAFADPTGDELLDALDLRHVTVPMANLGAPDGVGVPVTADALRALTRGIDRLRAACVPVELLVFDWQPRESELLHELLSLMPEQITNVRLGQPGDDGCQGDEERRPELDALLPWPGDLHIVQRELMAFRGALLEHFERGDAGEWLSPDSFLALDTNLGRHLTLGGEAIGAPRELRFSVDSFSLTEGLGALEGVLPLVERSGHRISLRRVGDPDHGPAAQSTHNRSLLTRPLSGTLRHLRTLTQRFPDTVSHRGFGFVLLRPWTTPEQLLKMLGETYEGDDQQRNNDNDYWEQLFLSGMLADVLPPSLPGLDAPPTWACERESWRIRDPRVERAAQMLLALACVRTGQHLPAGQEAAPVTRAVGDALANLDEDKLPFPRLVILATRLALEFEDDDESDTTLADKLVSLTAPVVEEDDGPPLTAQEKAIRSAQSAIEELLSRITQGAESPFAGWNIEPTSGIETVEGNGLCVALGTSERRRELTIFPAEAEVQALFAGQRVCLRHHSSDEPESETSRETSAREVASIESFGHAVETYLDETAQLDASDIDDEARSAALALAMARYEESLRKLLAARNGDEEAEVSKQTSLTLALRRQAALVQQIAERLASAPRSPLPGWGLEEFTEREDHDGYVIELVLEREGRRMKLALVPGDVPRPALAEGRYVKLVTSPDAPLPASIRRRNLPALCRLIDHYLARAAK